MDDRVVISIEDNGKGMNEREQKKGFYTKLYNKIQRDGYWFIHR